ncbi:MAG: hypothetical protein ABSG15_14785 [FCB group bacterium]|jgi:hypothetical protein
MKIKTSYLLVISIIIILFLAALLIFKMNQHHSKTFIFCNTISKLPKGVPVRADSSGNLIASPMADIPSPSHKIILVVDNNTSLACSLKVDNTYKCIIIGNTCWAEIYNDLYPGANPPKNVYIADILNPTSIAYYGYANYNGSTGVTSLSGGNTLNGTGSSLSYPTFTPGAACKYYIIDITCATGMGSIKEGIKMIYVTGSSITSFDYPIPALPQHTIHVVRVDNGVTAQYTISNNDTQNINVDVYSMNPMP